jgi:uncharacterized protein YutE (UPF0331/DUF86 family)
VRPSTLRRLERFNKGVEILEELKNYKKEDFCEDLKVLSMAERNLQVCAEFIVDLSAYVLSKLGVGVPETYKEIVERIHAAGVIDEGLKRRLLDVVGLRNIIVHMYADVKAELIYENLNDLISTLKSSAKRLLEFCKERGIDP